MPDAYTEVGAGDVPMAEDGRRYEYVKIVSFHVVRHRYAGGAVRTYCGRLAGDITVAVMPLSEKSCEVCLRIAITAQDGL